MPVFTLVNLIWSDAEDYVSTWLRSPALHSDSLYRLRCLGRHIGMGKLTKIQASCCLYISNFIGVNRRISVTAQCLSFFRWSWFPGRPTTRLNAVNLSSSTHIAPHRLPSSPVSCRRPQKSYRHLEKPSTRSVVVRLQSAALCCRCW
jgi:hypothetical protein